MLEASFVVSAATLPLEPWPLDSGQVVEGTPSVSVAIIDDDDPVQRGIWEHTPGVTRDVEANELFVVLAGRATIEVENGTTLDLKPGTVGVFRAEERTVWTVHETLRKVFQITRG